MAGNVNTVRIGPCWLTWGGTDLGYTKGGTVVSKEIRSAPIVVQDLVKAIAVIRVETTVDLLFAETDYSKLQDALGLILTRGDDLVSKAKTLVITSVMDPTDVTTITGAYPTGRIRAPFMLDQERVWSTQFKSESATPNLTFTGAS